MAPDNHDVSTLEELREIYRQPHERVVAKKTSVIDDLTKDAIEGSPFFLLSTSSSDGACDVSPRGGPPGQIRVLDQSTVAFPDLSGNNLLDSLTNIIDNPHAGLLLLTPGRDETLRIDGTAKLTTDPAILGLWDDDVRTPNVAIVLDVDNTFIHCAKAFRRAGLWDPATWRRFGELPDAIALFLAHTEVEADPDDYRAAFEESYRKDLDDEKPS